MAPSKKRKNAPSQANPKIPKRAKNHRTKQSPWEASREDDQEYTVETITNKEHRKGLPYYRVVWSGCEDKDATWEPAENLVGAAATVRAFDEGLKVKEAARKKAVKEAREAAAADRKRREEQSEEEALNDAIRRAQDEGGGGDDPTEGSELQPIILKDGRHVLEKHKRKASAVWDAYDLTKEKPTCTCATNADGTGQCGTAPAQSGGTQNYWTHLYVHHRPVWLALKKKEGSLTDVGETELQLLDSLHKGRQKLQESSRTKIKLPKEGKAVLDRLAGEAQGCKDVNSPYKPPDH